MCQNQNTSPHSGKCVLIIHHSGSIGGAGISLIHIVKALMTQGYAVHVILPSSPDSLAKELEKTGCEMTFTEVPMLEFYNGGIRRTLSLDTVRRLVKIAKNYCVFRRLIQSSPAAIVAVNSFTLCWMGKLIYHAGRRAICFHRETYPQGLFGFRKWVVVHQLSHWFDDVVFISEYDRRVTGPICSRTMVLFDKVDLDNYRSVGKEEARAMLGFTSNQRYVLYLGGLSALKGAHVAVKALKYLDDSVRLVMLNINEPIVYRSLSKMPTLKAKISFLLRGGIYENKVFRMLQKNQLFSRVDCYPATPHPEIFYQACDVVIVPSTLPHQSRSVYEAGISRIPIIISDYENTAEFARDRETAVTFIPSNSRDLATKITSVLSQDLQSVLDLNYQNSIRQHDVTTLAEELEVIMHPHDDSDKTKNMPRCLVASFFNSSNIGDKLIAHTLQESFDSEFLVQCVDFNEVIIRQDDLCISAAYKKAKPSHLSHLKTKLGPLVAAWLNARHPKWRVYQRLLEHSNCLIIGGGNMLMDLGRFPIYTYSFYRFISMAKRCGLPIYVMDIGVGPFQTRWQRRLAWRSLRMASYISVRDEKSQSQFGIGVVSRDPAFLLDPVAQHTTMSGRIGLCIYRQDNMLFPGGYPAYVAAIIELVHSLLYRYPDKQVVLYSTERCDYQAIDDVFSDGAGFGPAVSVSHVTSLKEVLALYATFDIVIAMRMHSLIIALTQGIPCIALSWQDKITDLFRMCGLSNFVFALPSLPEKIPQVVSAVGTIEERYNEIAETVARIAQCNREIVNYEIRDVIASIREGTQSC